MDGGPVAARWVGAHVSAAGGVANAVLHGAEIGASAVAMFLRNQRTWQAAPLSQRAVVDFEEACRAHGIDRAAQVLPHGSYLVNLANPDDAKRQRSYAALLDDLRRCEALGIALYNLHPGSTVGACSREHAVALVAAGINRAVAETRGVTIVLENMAGQRNVIGSRFEELAAIIGGVAEKSRVGVCLDTCHLFAAGYDIRTAGAFEGVMQEFDRVVGARYLRGVHLNDSKGALGSGLDRHEKIGRGRIGIEAFRFVMQSDRFRGIPMVLETPLGPGEDHTAYAGEIGLLRSLCGRA